MQCNTIQHNTHTHACAQAVDKRSETVLIGRKKEDMRALIVGGTKIFHSYWNVMRVPELLKKKRLQQMRTVGGRSVSEMQGEKYTSLAVCIWKNDGLPPPAFLVSYLWCGGDGVIADDICLGSDITCTFRYSNK